MSRKFIFTIYFLLAVFAGKAQIGGESTYQFLELTNSARVAALGGTQVALTDSADLNLPFHNPALLHKGMHNSVLVNYVNYFADINFGYASYARHYEGIGNFALGMHYIDYGDFKEATEEGDLTGNYFNAAEYSLNMIYSSHYKRLSYGATLKPIFSVFESYRSFGLAADLGVNFSSKDSMTHVALVARNIGGQITTYYEDGNREPIPFNLQAGISTRLKYAPVVFSLTMQHLTNWDLGWSEEEDEQTLENMYERQESFAKQIMRHAVLGVEILPSPNFTLRAGYNYQRRQELKYDERLSTVGFSMGFGVKIKRFRLDFATSRFHLAGSSNLFSLAINLNERF
jgi:opacity protein-like surface antigen